MGKKGLQKTVIVDDFRHFLSKETLFKDEDRDIIKIITPFECVSGGKVEVYISIDQKSGKWVVSDGSLLSRGFYDVIIDYKKEGDENKPIYQISLEEKETLKFSNNPKDNI